MRPSVTRLRFPPHELWETRAGRGTPVALIHGLSGSSNWWGRNFDALAAEHLVAAVDLVGFGRNRRFLGFPAVLPRFGEVTALVARWLETFGEPVHIMGHSMGGQIAIRVAAEYPDLVRSLVLVNAAGMPFHFDPRPHLRSARRPPYGGPGIARVLIPDLLRAGPASVAIASARVILGDMREAMHAVRAPTLLVWGANDPLVPLPYGEAMQREIEGSRLVVIDRAAHVAMWDVPEEFNRVALDFLRDVEKTPAAAPEPRPFSWAIAGWNDGIAHRQAGRRRDLVLIHGLGMSSAYFEPLAAALYLDGWDPIAPDLPGFGESNDAPACGAEEHASILAKWADAAGVKDAAWVGHSIGCNAVAHLARTRPDLVRAAAYVGPLWTNTAHPHLRTFGNLFLDAMREPMSLYRYVIPAYWRAGIARWWLTWRRYLPALREEPPSGLAIAGERDPIPDRRRIAVIEVPGAHACVVSHPDALAQQIATLA